MNIFLWVIQALLALHTLIGAIWKFMNSSQVLPFENAIPPMGWMLLGVVEIVCVVLLIAPAFKKSLAPWVPLATLVIALEMLVFSLLHGKAQHPDQGPLIYWAVTGAISLSLGAARKFLRPI